MFRGDLLLMSSAAVQVKSYIRGLTLDQGQYAQTNTEMHCGMSLANNTLFLNLERAKCSRNAGMVATIRGGIIEYNMPLAHSVANSFWLTREMESGDYRSATYEGLVFAVDHYKASKGATFATYATPCIRGSLLNAWGESRIAAGLDIKSFWDILKAKKSEIDYWNYVIDLSGKQINGIILDLKQRKTNRSPESIAWKFDLLVEANIAIFDKVTSPKVSLDAKSQVYVPDRDGYVQIDRQAAEDEKDSVVSDVSNAILRRQLEIVLSSLPLDHQFVIAMRYGLEELADRLVGQYNNGETQARYLQMARDKARRYHTSESDLSYTSDEIGNVLGFAWQKIDGILRRAFGKLRDPGRKRQLRDYFE